MRGRTTACDRVYARRPRGMTSALHSSTWCRDRACALTLVASGFDHLASRSCFIENKHLNSGSSGLHRVRAFHSPSNREPTVSRREGQHQGGKDVWAPPPSLEVQRGRRPSSEIYSTKNLVTELLTREIGNLNATGAV